MPSAAHGRQKRDSITSHHTSNSQENHPRKSAANELRADTINTAVTSSSSGGGAGGGGRGVGRAQSIVRTAQTRCEMDQTVFKVQKGVRTYDLCTEKNVLVTGGMDRVVRVWNPYLPSRPVARLRGHGAPVFLVKIAMEDNRLFTISTDKAVLVSALFQQRKIVSVRANISFLNERIRESK